MGSDIISPGTIFLSWTEMWEAHYFLKSPSKETERATCGSRPLEPAFGG